MQAEKNEGNLIILLLTFHNILCVRFHGLIAKPFKNYKLCVAKARTSCKQSPKLLESIRGLLEALSNHGHNVKTIDSNDLILSSLVNSLIKNCAANSVSLDSKFLNKHSIVMVKNKFVSCLFSGRIWRV